MCNKRLLRRHAVAAAAATVDGGTNIQIGPCPEVNESGALAVGWLSIKAELRTGGTKVETRTLGIRQEAGLLANSRVA